MTQNPTVLYVEDDAHSRKVMKILLKSRMNLTDFVIFEDSVDFEAKIENLEMQPDIVFLDIHVAPKNGFEMLEALRNNPRYDGVPVLALTASVMNEEVGQLRAAGFDGCLSKPINLDTFPDAITRILAGEVIWNITN